MSDDDTFPRDAEPAEPPDLATRSAQIADTLNWLFTTKLPPDATRRIKPEYTNREVAAYVRRTKGVRCSESYISKLRNGHPTRPSMMVLEGIAEFFEVHPRIFSTTPPSLEDVRSQLEVLELLREIKDRGELPRIRAARAILSGSPEEVAEVLPGLTRALHESVEHPQPETP